jgi:LuxR family transcriptional regulator, maltose regulon positive regulatory protein
LLLSAAGLQRSREEITLLLWPESPGEKARKSFDTLLIRLRKTLQNVLDSTIDVRHFLTLNKGVLALENCRVDALEFREQALMGLRHCRAGENLQADNHFREAFRFFTGEFMAGMPLPDAAEVFRQDLLMLCMESASHWCTLLAAEERYDEAEEIAAKALRHDPINEDLIHAIYELHILQKRPVKAKNVLDDYIRTLRSEQFSEQEIEHILESFWTKHPCPPSTSFRSSGTTRNFF